MDFLVNEDGLDGVEEDDFDWEDDWEEEEENAYHVHMENQTSDNTKLKSFKNEEKISLMDSTNPKDNTDNDSILRRQVTVNDKAGLDKMVLDVDHINKVIYEASKDSKFFINEKRRDERIQQQTKKLQSKLSQLKAIWNQSVSSGNLLLPSFTQQQHLLSQVDKEVEAMSNSRDLTRCVLHVDMDMFYAAVEIRDNPELKGKPVAVGGTDMLSTSSYEARKFGVKSAMPGFIALQLCPSLIIVKPHYDKYKQAAEVIREVFRKYDPNFVSFSYDEASLDITSYIASNPSETIQSVAKKIQDEVCQNTQALSEDLYRYKETKWNIRVGGRFEIQLAYLTREDHTEILKFMRDLPIRKAKGIGKVSEKLLNALGIFKCGDIYDNRLFIFQLFSKTWASGLLRIALGAESSMYENSQSGRKSMSVERTFKSLSSKEEILMKCQELAFTLEKHLVKENLKGKTLTVKMKTVDFRVFTRSVTLGKFIQSAEDIIENSHPIIVKENREHGPLHLRLLGLRLNNFQTDNQEGLEKFFTASKENSPEKPKSNNNTIHNQPKQKTIEISAQEKSPQKKETRCPVCNKDLFAIEYSLALINQHIDSCLQQDSAPSNTSPPKRPKTTTIDSFFTKKSK